MSDDVDMLRERIKDLERDGEGVRERLNRIDRADDIAEWRRALQGISVRMHGAAKASERHDLYSELQSLVGRMR